MKTRSARGFTLVEMLVVIFIIGILAALLLPVLTGSIRQAQRTANAYEISQIAKAVEVYRDKLGDFPPSFGEDYSNVNGRPNTVVGRHLAKCYPKYRDYSSSDKPYTEFFDVLNSHQQSYASASTQPLMQAEALVFWLSQTAKDVRYPFTANLNTERNTYYEFDERRIVVTQDNFRAFKAKYGKDTYYYYFDSRTYASADGYKGPKPYWKTNGTEAINGTTYQIVCAGLDGEFGGENQATGQRKGWPFGPTGSAPVNTFSEDNDNQTNFSDGKILKDLLP